MRNFVGLIAVLVIVGAGYIVVQKRAAANLNNEGTRLLEAGRYAEAARSFEQAAKRNPGNPTVERNLAEARAQLDRETAAESKEAGLRARAAQRIERMRSEGWIDDDATLAETLETANVMFQMGKVDQAIILFERALFKNPDNMEIERRIEELEEYGVM